MTSSIFLADMKLGKAAIMFTGKGPAHDKLYANTVGGAVGSVALRTISVRFVYIDHSV